jgi:hypothetical protein
MMAKRAAHIELLKQHL